MEQDQGTLRITVHVHKGWGRTPSYTAQVGDMLATARTKTGAVEALAADVLEGLCKWEAPQIVQYGGLTALVYVRPDGGVVEEITRTDGGRSFSQMGRIGVAAGTRHALVSMVQRLTEWADDASVWQGEAALVAAGAVEAARDHLRYAGWQRAYSAGKVANVPQLDLHQYATEHQAEHTPASGVRTSA